VGRAGVAYVKEILARDKLRNAVAVAIDQFLIGSSKLRTHIRAIEKLALTDSGERFAVGGVGSGRSGGGEPKKDESYKNTSSKDNNTNGNTNGNSNGSIENVNVDEDAVRKKVMAQWNGGVDGNATAIAHAEVMKTIEDLLRQFKSRRFERDRESQILDRIFEISWKSRGTGSTGAEGAASSDGREAMREFLVECLVGWKIEKAIAVEAVGQVFPDVVVMAGGVAANGQAEENKSERKFGALASWAEMAKR
jgi:hypothetical protein